MAVLSTSLPGLAIFSRIFSLAYFGLEEGLLADTKKTVSLTALLESQQRGNRGSRVKSHGRHFYDVFRPSYFLLFFH
jgi:hypothetical protein